MGKILLTYCSFVIACLVVIVAFITATTYIQLAVAILLYPLLVFFALKVLPFKTKNDSSKKPINEIPLSVAKPTEKLEEVKRESIGIADIDKRVFLKLIGGAGVFLFLFSLVNKKAEGLFFKSLPGSVQGKISLEDIAGNKIDPAQNQPMDGYRISEIEDDVIAFYGSTNKAGAWYIMKADTNTGSFRYARGDSNFPGNWNNRTNLKYDYFNNIF